MGKHWSRESIVQWKVPGFIFVTNEVGMERQVSDTKSEGAEAVPQQACYFSLGPLSWLPLPFCVISLALASPVPPRR